MNCREAKNQISLLVDDYLDERDRKLLLQHSESCDECRALYNDMKKAVTRLSDMESVALPEGFENRMHFALKREATEKKKSKYLKYSMIAMPAAAMVVAVVLGVNFILTGAGMKKESTENDMFMMDTRSVEQPKEECKQAVETNEEATTEGVMPKAAYGMEFDSEDSELSGATNIAKSFTVVVKNQLSKQEKLNTLRSNEYMDVAMSIAMSLGVDENSIVLSKDGESMTVFIPVEQYEDFVEAVKDNDFVIENEPSNIDEMLAQGDNSYFEVTFLFQQ